MTTQSKSVLVPFLIVSGLLLAAALGWKFMAGDGDELTQKSAPVGMETQPVDEIKPTEKMVAKPEPVEVKDPAVNEPMEYVTPADREVAMKQARLKMNYAMRYPTPEKALDALKRFHNQGDQNMVNNIIDFMGDAYPNTAIPAEFLDQ